MKQSTVETTLLEEIREAQQQDGQCIRVLRNQMEDEDKRYNFRVRDGIVTSSEKYFIPDNKVLRNKLLMSYHDNAGHIGRQKTFELINRLCIWPKLFEDVQHYIQQCVPCQ